MSTWLRIEDLREPVLNDVQRAALAAAQAAPPALTVDAVLAGARERTGLSDFGPDDFHERLELLLEEVAWEGATAYAQRSTFRRMVSKAIDRLLTVDLVGRHPEIREEPIQAPIVVAGLPRSGTTHLLNLLAADSRLQAMPYYEVLRPVPLMPEDAIGDDGVDPRWARAAAGWEQAQRMNPFAAAFHPMDPGHISEDGELQMADFSSYVWEFSIHAPRWRDYYLAHDQTPHYEYQKLMMQVLQWQRRSRRRWVVKAPQHFEQLRAILNVFEDAFFVFTHRDPLASLQSIVQSQSYTARFRERAAPDLDYHLAYWSDRYGTLLDRYLRDEHLLAPGQRCDVLFHEFVGDDVATARRILAAAGLPAGPETDAELHRFMAGHGRDRHGKLVFDLSGNYGADPAALRRRYAAYIGAAGVKTETS